MAKDPDGNKIGTEGDDLLWGSAIIVGDEIDNNIDTINGLGGDDEIFGDIYNDGTDYVEGDTLNGGSGNDTIYGDTGSDDPNWQTNIEGGSDTIHGDEDDDTLYGQAGNDNLYGDGGNDLLVGGLGADYLLGGDGDDIIWTDLHENFGSSSVQGLNRAWGGIGNDTLNGGLGADELYGEDGGDIIEGGGGSDKLEGSNGDDKIHGGDGDDYIEGAGYYATNDDGDNLLFGDSGNDTILGGDGDDYVDGGTGADALYCSAGNDTYVIDDLGDTLNSVTSDTGTDLVRSSITWVLGAYQENLVLTGSGDINATGNSGKNMLVGNSGDNLIRGNGGRDVLRGGLGEDTFVFASLSDSGKSAGNRDQITDFRRAQDDEIDLRLIDANSKQGGNQNFKFIGNQDFHDKAGELRFAKSGGDTFVYGDVNGDGKADFSIEIDGNMNFKAGDFVL